MRVRMLAIGWSLAAAPVAAQTAEALPGDGNVDAVEENAAPAQPGLPVAKDKPSLTITAQFAPTIAGNAPIRDGERLSDYQTNSVSLTGKLPFAAGPAKGLGVDLSLETGLKHNLDLDDDSTDDEFETAFYANTSLNWARGVRRLSPFVGLGYERGFGDFFEDKVYGDTKLSGGVRFLTSEYSLVSDPKVKTMSFRLVASVERAWSTSATRERWAPRLAGELKTPLGGGVAATLTATGERRIYDRLAAQRRLDWRITTIAAVDFAGLVKNSTVIQKLQLGLRWAYVDSNITGKSSSTAQLLPIIAIGTVFK